MRSDRSGSIVVVDDNPATLYATSRVLRHSGFDVREAETGLDGVEMAKEAPVDLVVLDIDLPDIDGYEVCRRIRAMPSTNRVRVVYLSASFVDDKHKVRGFEAGADGFLTHPVEPEVLIATVGALLRTRAIEEELEQLLESERQAREEAERANRAKDDFLATLSHELRSPLTAVVGWADVALIRAREHPALLSAIQAIARNARLQARLISDLLDVSRITAGKLLQLDLDYVAIGEIIETSIESVAKDAARRGIRLDRQLDSPTATVFGDSGRLVQIVTNLLSNAVKFSNADAVIEVGLTSDDAHVYIVVRDYGCGIAPDVLPRVFDRFWQEETSSRRSHGGLGLGLSIVKHLTALHGGTVSAASDGEGHGVTLTVTLPVASPRSVALVKHAGVSPTPEGEISLSGLRVLIVDDDTDGREWVRHVLTNAGAEALDVASVTDALATVEAFAPCVVLSDLAMPVRDGFDLLAALRAGGRETAPPVIALSAYASADDKHRALNSGFNYFVAKPPSRDELLRTVWRACRERSESKR